MATSLDGLKEALPEVKWTKAEVEKKYTDLLQKFRECCPEPRCRDINFLYHVTTKDAKQEIVRDEKLRKSVAHPLPRKPESPIDEMKIQGVYFTLNLAKRMNILPKKSKHGTERVCIPISNFSGYDLFFNSYHYNRACDNFVYFVILVMVKPSHSDYDKISKVLKKLDPSSNDIFLFKSPYCYYHYYKKEDKTSFNAIVEVFVVGDVPVGDDAVWDTVSKK